MFVFHLSIAHLFPKSIAFIFRRHAEHLKIGNFRPTFKGREPLFFGPTLKGD